jgi:hypothetical protein
VPDGISRIKVLLLVLLIVLAELLDAKFLDPRDIFVILPYPTSLFVVLRYFLKQR